jgi:hypothetical protein
MSTYLFIKLSLALCTSQHEGAYSKSFLIETCLDQQVKCAEKYSVKSSYSHEVRKCFMMDEESKKPKGFLKDS